eukprot:4271435-Alexandrium_andersonii.AAC.1
MSSAFWNASHSRSWSHTARGRSLSSAHLFRDPLPLHPVHVVPATLTMMASLAVEVSGSSSSSSARLPES